MNKAIKLSLISVFALQTGCASIKQMLKHDAKKDNSPYRVITMKAPDGSLERFTDRKAELESTDAIVDIADLPLDHVKKRGWLCKNKKDTQWRDVRRVESELELSFMIEHLKDTSKPRQLSAQQAWTLKRIPPCTPYLGDLKIVSRLVSGYDLVSVHKHNP